MKLRSVVFACAVLVAIVGFYFVLKPKDQNGVDQNVASNFATNSDPSPAETTPSATPTTSNQAALMTNQPVTTPLQIGSVINPYASGLREPGRSKRVWDVGFLRSHQKVSVGDPITFELTEGRMASGTIGIVQLTGGELTYMSGELTEPETGKFFFLKPPEGGKAGKAVGVIEFPSSEIAYRIEPTGVNGEPELWRRRLDEVICVSLPQPIDAAANQEPMEIPPLRPDLVPNYVPAHNSNVISLQSLPGSPAVLLLDFFGGYTPTWGGVNYSKPANVSNAMIKDLWKRVAEDFMPFNINVTTDIQVYQAAPAASRQRCVFTDTPITPAGVAYFGSWNWGNDTPCWSVYTSGKSGAEVGAHEPGHTLGLSHMTQGNISGTTNEYYAGHGSGPTGWAPIMGVGYYQPVSSWARGEFQFANNFQDELLAVTTQNNNVTYRTDDTGANLASSRHLDLFEDHAAAGEGVIERSGDVDAFQFTTTGGQMSLTASPVGDWANLGLRAALADAADIIIASNNPQSTLSVTITTNLPAGTYTFRVIGAAKGNPLNTGFTDYGSLGYFSMSGFVGGGRRPTRLSVAEHSPIGTVVGTVPAATTGDAISYSIVSGNMGGTFAIDTNGVVTVANNSQLDYDQLASTTMFPVQFELFVNIVNLSNPGLTELNRRVVISVLSGEMNYPIAATGYNAGVIVPYDATPALPRATAFDIPNNFCFYQGGLNANAFVSGSGGMQGLPASGIILSPIDNTVFQLGPAGGTNALLMGYTNPNSRTLVLNESRAYNSIAILAASANGGGTGRLVLHFTNGTSSQPLNFNAHDWYFTLTNVAVQGFGRIRLGQPTLQTEHPGAANPNLYQTTLDLAGLGLNETISAITFTNPAGGVTRVSGVFALSGSPMPPQVVISRQPGSTTNINPALASTFSVVAMGTPPLSYQWYRGNPGSGSLLNGETSSTLSINPVETTDAGNYYVVVTNSSSTATSVVASLTVFRAPEITQQPSPTNLVLFVGQKAVFTVGVNGAVPISYSWRTNGIPIPGATSSTLTQLNLQTNRSGDYRVVVSNAFGSVTSSVVSLSVVAPTYPYAQVVLADNPIAFWRLNEVSGTIAHDYIGGRNGTYTNVQLNQPGNNLIDTNRAARFGILSPADSYAGGIPIDFATLTNANFSVEAWVFGGTQSTDAGLVTKGTGAGGEQFNLDCGGPGRAFRFFVRDRGGTARLAVGNIQPGNLWRHVVGVCNQSNGIVVLYVNGVSNAVGSIPANSGILASANAMTIGSRQSGTTTYNNQFVGTMSEVAIYNYALTPAQVQSHYSTVTNRPPIFLSNPFTQPIATAGIAYSGAIATNVIEPNGSAIAYSKVSGPSWLNVSVGGVLSGTPSAANANTNFFVVSARDTSSLSNVATMLIHVNAAPAFTSDPFYLPRVNSGSTITGTLATYAADPNPSDLLSFQKLAGPGWLAVNPDGALSGAPAGGDIGTNFFTVIVSDPAGLSNSAALQLVVNGPPAFSSNPVVKPGATSGLPYSDSLAGNVVDPNDGEIFFFELVSGPGWLNVAADGGLSGTPGSANGGTNNFVVRVTDAGDLFDTADMNLFVTVTEPLVMSISALGQTNYTLHWAGGVGPFEILARTNLSSGDWETLVGPIGSNSYNIVPTNGTMFYRVRGQ